VIVKCVHCMCSTIYVQVHVCAGIRAGMRVSVFTRPNRTRTNLSAHMHTAILQQCHPIRPPNVRE